MTDPITRFIEAIAGATIPDCGAFAADAELDATVPNWRFTVRGADDVQDTLAEWFADPGHFETITRVPVAGGEVVHFVLTWEEHGEPHMCHQAHILEVDGGLIVRDTAFCGGRWNSALMAEMEEAASAVAV